MHAELGVEPDAEILERTRITTHAIGARKVRPLDAQGFQRSDLAVPVHRHQVRRVDTVFGGLLRVPTQTVALGDELAPALVVELGYAPARRPALRVVVGEDEAVGLLSRPEVELGGFGRLSIRRAHALAAAIEAKAMEWALDGVVLDTTTLAHVSTEMGTVGVRDRDALVRPSIGHDLFAHERLGKQLPAREFVRIADEKPTIRERRKRIARGHVPL